MFHRITCSGYMPDVPFEEKMSSTTSTAIVAVLRYFFNTLGNPERIYMDNGPDLVSKEVNNFLRDRRIPIPEPSAPYYTQANGLAELAVKQMKHLLKKYQGNWEVFQDNLLEWRDTPNDRGSTLAEMFLGRCLRTSLPTLPGKPVLTSRKLSLVGHRGRTEER